MVFFACNGILFNHESPRRGETFVTRKITMGLSRIHLGLQKYLFMGNLDSQRDWGHSKDYVKAMHLILNHNEPNDFVVSTGETHSIRELCELVFSKLKLNYKDFVKINPKFIRPQELSYLCGDSSKIRKTLNWKPHYSFEMLINEMLEHFLKIY